jgi:non-heme chloroperoxidase
MSRVWKFLVGILLLTASTARAQDITGTWQATLGRAPNALRVIFQIAGANGRLSIDQFSIDQTGFDTPFPADTVTYDNGVLRAVFNRLRAIYQGSLAADMASITGTWTQGGPARPLVFARATNATAWRDPSPHGSRFVAVDREVMLEVLDWGGRGRPVVLLAGAGNSAHVFDQFATKLTPRYRVYGITRRGFGFSSKPTSGYSADRLADDVLAVLDSLAIERPVLIGHSIAGEELSSIGSRRHERVAGLVYLDGGYGYAYYDSTQENVLLNIADVRRKLARISPMLSPKDLGDILDELVDVTLPLLERDMRAWSKRLAARPDRLVTPPAAPRDPIADSLFGGQQKYTTIRGPVLAIYAAPRELPAAIAKDSAAIARSDSTYMAAVMPQINAFERGIPGSRVVRIPRSNHYVFRSHEAEVLREIATFIDGLR